MKLQMSLRQATPIALLFGCLTPALLHAQTLDPATPQKAPETAAVGGKLSVDLVFLKPDTLGVPLRHGAVIAGSEAVTYNGRKLRRGEDYSIDNEAGVVYLLIQTKPGNSVSVNYRYDASRAHAGETVQSGSLIPFRMDFGGNNAMGVTLGLGLAERGADGTVTSSNIFGWNNSFNLGGSNLSGLMLVGQKTQENAKSAFEYQANAVAPDQGKSHLIMQSLGGNLGGGTFKLDFQDVSKNFSGFSAVQANGYSSDLANQLSKEKGLKRMGFSMDKVQLGSLGFSNSFRKVGDESGGITWQNFGLNSGGLSFNYKSQVVDQKFNRFKDLAEGDREQLAREAGLARNAMDAVYKMGFGALSFSTASIDDSSAHKGINKQDLKFTGSAFNFDMGSQVVETGFSRFSSLNDPEALQWGRESGLKRRWLSFDSLALGAKNQPLKFSEYSIDSPTGGMKNLDASAGNSKWSFEHIRRSVDKGFTSLPNLKPEEINANIAAISNMYAKGGLPVTPDFTGYYFQSAGLDRDFTRLTFNPSPTWKLGIETLQLGGKQGDASVNNFTMSGGGLDMSYRHQDLGPKFSELTSLMQFEQQRLGTMPGLDRTDFNLSAKMRKGATLAFGKTNADTATGGLDRQTLAYNDRTMQFSLNNRSVGPNFNSVGQLLDPEAPMLAQMVGFKQSDYQFKWQAMSNLRLEASSWSGYNNALDQHRAASNMLVDWGNKGTHFQFQRNSSDSNNPLDMLLANMLQRMSFTQAVGNGTLSFNQQEAKFDGTQTTQPDAKQTDIAYETKLNATTSLRTQQTRTNYSDGGHENVSSNTINTELGKKAGLSLTDVNIDRTGNSPDEHKRNLGFWVSLWNGIRLNVGMNDALNDAGSSVTQHNVALTPGTVGNMQVGSANYVANGWQQGDRTQAMSNISLNTVKPFDLGFFKGLKLNVGQDTAADNGAWLKENKTFGLSGKVGHNTFGYSYFGQMNNLEQRGVDRTFAFATDPNDKSRLSLSLLYKYRTLPGDQEIAIRNFSVTARPWAGVQLTNEMLTNPEIPRGDVLLGSMPQPTRVNRWKLDYNRDPNCKITGSWEEQRNDETNALTRLGGMTLTMFEKRGSPVSLFLGVEQRGGNVPGHIANRWSLRWDQRPGPNQALSLFIGNVTYGGTLDPGEKHRNLSVDFQYQFKF